LIFYLALLGIFLPYLAGKWWYGTQKVTKDGILVDSAGKLVREYDEEMTEGDVITVVSSGEEYESAVSQSHLARIEQSILAEGQLSKYAGGLDILDKGKLLDMDDPTRRKVLALLWAHLGRVDLGDGTLNKGWFSSYMAMPLTQSRKICRRSNCLASERRPQHHVARLF
jgi:translocation protein SEC63